MCLAVIRCCSAEHSSHAMVVCLTQSTSRLVQPIGLQILSYHFPVLRVNFRSKTLGGDRILVRVHLYEFFLFEFVIFVSSGKEGDCQDLETRPSFPGFRVVWSSSFVGSTVYCVQSFLLKKKKIKSPFVCFPFTGLATAGALHVFDLTTLHFSSPSSVTAC